MPPQPTSNKKVTDFFKPIIRTNKEPTTRPSEPMVGPTTPARPEAPSADMLKPPTLKTPSSQLLREASEAPSSGLSSVPSSQEPTPAPAKPRVIPSSDGEESSDESDLEDPLAKFRSTGNAAKRVPPPPPPPPPKRKATKDPLGLPHRSIPIQPVKYKFSLDRLLEENNKSLAIDEDLKRAQILIDEAERKKNEPVDKRALVAAAAELAMGGDSGDQLLAVMDRKDVWRINDMVWEFFDHNMVGMNKNQIPFPIVAMKDHPAFALAGDVAIREQMFLSGFYEEIAVPSATLPDEVLIWMLDQICLEPRDDLAYSYYNSLLKHLHLRRDLLTKSRIESLLELSGGKKEALDLDRQLQVVHLTQISETVSQKWRFFNIKLLVQLIGEIDVQDEKLVQYACGVLIRISLDEKASKQAGIVAAVEDSLHSILSRIPESEWENKSKEIARIILSTILRPQFRKRVLAVLPVSSPRLHLFRRRLACAFLFEDNSYMTREYTDLVKLSRFSKLLMEDRFKIRRESTNYAELQTLISILDVAIDNGATTEQTIAEKDSEVDGLVEQLRSIFSRIIDTNARDLTRSEAKDMLDRLIMRLTFQVRSKQKMALDLRQSTISWVA